jgi:hypothetical protein
VLWSLTAAVVFTAVGAFLSPELAERWARVLWAVGVLLAGPLLLGIGLFIHHLYGYRRSGFQDNEWIARHGDSPGVLDLELARKTSAGPDPTLVLEVGVKSGGRWEFVEDRDLRLWPDNVIRCRFHEMHRLYPSGFYEVRWFRLDRAKFVEVTREKFQLKNHSSVRNRCGGEEEGIDRDYRESAHDQQRGDDKLTG